MFARIIMNKDAIIHIQSTLVISTSVISKRKSDPCLTSVLTSGNKILWVRGEIAPQEQFLPFTTIFSTHIYNIYFY